MTVIPAQNFASISGSGEVFYPVGAGGFNGTTTYLAHTANDLTISATSTFSCWINLAGGDGTQMIIFDGFTNTLPNTSAEVFRDSSNKIHVGILYVMSLTQFEFQFQTINSYTAGSGWLHLAISWDINHGAGSKLGQIYINGVSDCTIVSDTGVGTTSLNSLQHFVGGNISELFKGSISELYLNTNTMIDFSVKANLRKFLSASKRPVFLGLNGSLPTGAQPAIYLRGNGTGFNIESGSSPNYIVNGTLSTPTTTPSSP